MEVCDLAPGDIQFGKRSGQLTVRSGKRNKQREVPLVQDANVKNEYRSH